MNVYAGDMGGPTNSSVVSTTAIQVKPMPTNNGMDQSNHDVELALKQAPSTSAGHYYWEKWPGRNRPFACFGTVTLLARNTGILGCNVLLIVGNAGLFIWGVSWHIHPACTVFAILITLGTLALLAKATLTEAGIIPRRRLDEFPPMSQASRDGYTNGPLIPAPTGMMDGVSVPLKWCRTCNIYRPLRASHCRECDCCVEEFDHHCPWVCNCIGKRNYRFFVGFLFMVVLLDVYVLFFSCFLLGWASVKTFGGSFASAVSEYPIAIVEALVAFVFLWCLGSLFGYHFFLILNNMTTNEHIKHSRAERAANVTLPPSQQWQAEEAQRTRERQLQTYQHTPSCSHTCYELLCAPTPESLFDLEAWIPEQQLGNSTAASTTMSTALSSASSGFPTANGAVRQRPSLTSHTVFSNAGLPTTTDHSIDAAAQQQHQREFEMDLARSRAEYEQRRAVHSQQQIQQQQLHRLMEAEMQARRGGVPMSLPYRMNVYPDPLPSFNPYENGLATNQQIDSDVLQHTRARAAMVDRERDFILNDGQPYQPSASVRVHIDQ